MKTPLLILTVLGVGAIFTASAAHLSPEEALARVKQSSRIKGVAGNAATSPELQSTIGNLYIFSSPEGYMILPASDKAPVLLGYSENGKFAKEPNPELQYWLDFYNREIDYIESIPGNGASVPLKAASTRPDREPISPLTKTRWNQESPYNDKCPELNGRRSVTGCVATAMAQVMKYHNWPKKGKGEHSYQWKTGNEELSFDFGSTSFDWGNMTDLYSENSTRVEKDAVATLMLACGISVDMDYTPDESSASSIVMGTSLLDYFDYDRALWMPMRDFYGLYEWEDMIYADLKKGLPVLYCGQGTAGGHQFICDGYRSDGYFHFNWGWGGMSDGYFLLTALNPANLGVGGGAGGFNSGQQVALGVQPPVEGSTPTYIMYCVDNFLPTSTQVASGEELGCSGGFYNYSMSALPKDAAIGMHITSSDGSYNKYLESHKVSDLGVLYGYNEYKIIFPSLSDGTYTITPAFYNGKEWSEMPTPIGKTGSIIATVTDGTALLSSPAPASESISVTEITIPSTVYMDTKFPITFTVENNSNEEYIGEITPVLADDSGNPVASSVYRPVDLIGGMADTVTDYVGQFSALKGVSFVPGSYYLVFYDGSGYPLSDPVEVNVVAHPESTSISVTDFRLISENPITDKSDVRFGFDITCTEGYFADELHVYVFPYKEGSVQSVASGSSGIQYINAGETKDVTATLDLNTLEPGKYFAMAYYGSSRVTDNQIVFEISVASGITDISYSDPHEQKEEIYNLHGQRCNRPLMPGIYVINGKKTLIK